MSNESHGSGRAGEFSKFTWRGASTQESACTKRALIRPPIARPVCRSRIVSTYAATRADGSQAELSNLVVAAEKVCDAGESRKSPAVTWLRRRQLR